MEKKRTKILKNALKEDKAKYANLENDLKNEQAQVLKIGGLLADKDKRYKELCDEKMTLEETVIKL